MADALIQLRKWLVSFKGTWEVIDEEERKKIIITDEFQPYESPYPTLEEWLERKANKGLKLVKKEMLEDDGHRQLWDFFFKQAASR